MLRGRRDIWRIPRALCATLALLCTMSAAILIAGDTVSEASYAALSEEVGRNGCTTLAKMNAGAVGWLAVEGTTINHPIAQIGEGMPAGYYLTHDLWGRLSAAGCPYLDRRASANGDHLLIFGHTTGAGDMMFSSIRGAHRQALFDTIGEARWRTPEGDSLSFMPVMAMRVDKTYAPIQIFDFTDAEELRTWLRTLETDATAWAEERDALCETAERVLTLVTCSSAQPGTRDRTLLLFAA